MRGLLVVVPALLAASPLAVAAPTDPPADRARGLENPDPVDAADVALALPRIALAIPRLGVRLISYPIIGLVRLEERHHVVSWLQDLFYNDARTAAIIPFAVIDSSLGAAAGVSAFHDDLFGHDESLRLRARFGGVSDQSYQLSFRIGHATTFSALGRYERHDDLLFHGIGADGPESEFEQRRILGIARIGQRLGPIELVLGGLYNHRRFLDDDIEEDYDVTMINGYLEGVETVEAQAAITLQAGPVRGEVFFGGVPVGADYLHFGAELALFIDLWAPGRMLVTRAFVEGVHGEDIPFTDLPRLGGATRLRGYRLDRFRGEVAMLGTLEYRYPVHQFISGALFVDVGKVTDNSWRAGGGIGFVVQSGKRQLLNFDIAYGESIQFILSTDPLRAFSKKDTEL
jgi:Omp85 superfamily domain